MILFIAPICTNVPVISMFWKWGCTSIQPVITEEKLACEDTSAMIVTKLLFLCHLSSFSDDNLDSDYLKTVQNLLKEKGIK